MKSRTGPDGSKTTYAYWPDGQTMYVTNALNQTTFYAYDIAGRQDHVVDALNRTNRFTYDAVGRMVKTIFHDGTFTTNVFNLLGQRVGVKDQADRLTQFAYDLSGQLTNVTKPQVIDGVTGSPVSPIWSYTYDSYGRLTVTTDPKSQSTTNIYDQFGRQVSRLLTTGGDGETNHYNSLGQLTNHYDFKGQRVQFKYDRYGRLTNKFYFAANDMVHPSNSVSYTFNHLGQLTNIIERSGTYANIGYLAAVGNPGKRGRFATMLASVEQLPPGPTGGVLGLILCGVATMIWLTAEARRRRVPTWQFARIVLATLRLNFSTPTGVASSHARTQIPQWLLRVWPSCIFRLPPSLLSLCSLVAFMLRCGGTPEGTPKRFRLPACGWRFATIITLVALIGSDPRFDGLWTARAACDIPSNPTLTQDERITTFTYDLEGRLAQVNSP